MPSRCTLFTLAAAAALVLGCGHPGPPSTASTAVGAEPPAVSASDDREVVAMVAGLGLAGHEGREFREGLLSSNLVVLDTRLGRLFIHSDALPEVGGRHLQLGDLVSFAPPEPHFGGELSRLESFRFLNAPGTAPDAQMLSAFYAFVPQYLQIMPPGFFPPVRTRPGILPVTAVVVGLALAAREETLVGGKGVVSNLVVLAIDSPAGPARTITTYSYALPAVGSRRVQLGDVLSFVPTVADDDGDFDQLAGLRFSDQVP
jgi:hypothetical protein